jgi:hypothetical protein
MPALEITDRNGQKQTVIDLQEKLEALKEGFFLDPRDADLSDIVDTVYPEPIVTDLEI